MRRRVLIGLVISALIGAYFFDNIRGYYRFKELCAQEKNRQFINKVEPNVGWILDSGGELSKYDAYFVAALPNVRFVRFQNYRDHQTYDVKYKGGDPGQDDSFEMLPSSSQEKVVYQWKNVAENFPNELRTSRYGHQVIDLRTKKVIVSLTNIGYSTFDRRHTLLDAPSGNTCEWYEYLGKDSNKSLIFGN